MSFSLDAVRKYGPPLEQKVNELSKALAKAQSDSNKIETDDVIGLGDTDHSLVKFYDELNFSKKLTRGTIGPLIVFEPDYDKLACWIRFNHLGWELMDHSGLGNEAEIFGEPCLTSGVDLGFFGGAKKSVCHAADSTATVCYKIRDNAKIRIKDKTIGHSIFSRFNLASMAQQASRDATLYEKYDDALNSVSLRVDPTGVVKYFVRRAGVDYFTKTTIPVVSINTNTDLIVTYTVTGNISVILINGVVKTNTALVEAADWNTETYDAMIWSKPFNTDSLRGFVNGKAMDFRWYDEKVLTTAMALNLFTNKISISGAAFGEVASVDCCIMPREPMGDSFTIASFTTPSFS